MWKTAQEWKKKKQKNWVAEGYPIEELTPHLKVAVPV